MNINRVILLLIVLLLESIPVLFVRGKKAWWKASVICNVVTNPVLNTVMLLVAAIFSVMDALILGLYVLEIVVVFLKAFFYQRMLSKAYWQCFLFSLIANFISFGTGMTFKDVFLSLL